MSDCPRIPEVRAAVRDARNLIRLALLADVDLGDDPTALGWAQLLAEGEPTYAEGSRVLGRPAWEVREAESRLLSTIFAFGEERAEASTLEHRDDRNESIGNALPVGTAEIGGRRW